MGTWMRVTGAKLGHLNDDPKGVQLMERIAPAEYRPMIDELQTIPPTLFDSYGDSIFVFSSCQFQNCSEKLSFLFDANTEIGLFYLASASDKPNPGTIVSTNCTRELFEDKYKYFLHDWLTKEGIQISEEVFSMKPTKADSLLENTHSFALKEFKAKRVATAADTLLALRNTNPREYGEYHVLIYNDLGYFLEQANRTTEAIEILEEVIAWDGRRAPAYLNIADAYQKAGDAAKAKANYQKYVDLMEKSGKGAKVPTRVRAYLKS
jgi:tetratricopeptide (TPR) repeat protein